MYDRSRFLRVLNFERLIPPGATMFNLKGISSVFDSLFSCSSSDPAITASSSLDLIGTRIEHDQPPPQPSNDASGDSQSASDAWGTAQNHIAAAEASSLFPTQSVTTETWGSIDTSFSSSYTPFDF